MASQEDITAQRNLLAAHRRTLEHYLEQEAMLGKAHIPPGVTHGIRDAQDDIRRVKATLRSWGVAVENHPDDEPSEEKSFIEPPADPGRQDAIITISIEDHPDDEPSEKKPPIEPPDSARPGRAVTVEKIGIVVFLVALIIVAIYAVVSLLTGGLSPTSVATCPTIVKVGETIQCEIKTAGEMHIYTFLAKAGDQVQISMIRGDTGLLEPEFNVYEPNAPNKEPLFFGTSRFSQPPKILAKAGIGVKLPKTGAYTVRAKDVTGTNTGAYTLQIIPQSP